MSVLGSNVILKFHYGKRGSVNPVISKTMGKVSVISHAYQSAMPQPGSFWVCRIDNEIQGSFIVTPLKMVPLENVKSLIPGMYDVEIKNLTVVLRPKAEVANIYWLVPFSIKKYYIKRHKAKVLYESVVVPLQLSEVFEAPRECQAV